MLLSIALSVWSVVSFVPPLSAQAPVESSAVDASLDAGVEEGSGAGPVQDGNTENEDASPANSGTEATSSEPTVETAPAPTVADRIATARADVAALRALLNGELPVDFNTQSLFEIDLTNNGAIDTRVRQLTASLNTAAERRTELLHSVEGETVSADVPDDGARESNAAEGTGLGAAEGTGLGAAEGTGLGAAEGTGLGSVEGTGLGSDSGAPTAPPTDSIPDELVLFDLETERDRLRAEFLTRSQAIRISVTQAEQQRQRIALERESADAAAEQAAAQAAAATEAQQTALEQARASASSVERDLLTERARLESARIQLAERAESVAHDRQAMAERAARRVDREHEFSSRILDSTLAPDEADRLYDRLVDELIRARGEFRSALDNLNTAPQVVDFESGIDLSTDAYRAFAEERSSLTDATAEFRQARPEVIAEAERFRWDQATALADEVNALNELRIRLLERLSRTKHEAVLGLGSEGVAQLGRELDQVQLMARWWWYRTKNAIPGWPKRLGGLMAQSTPRFRALAVLIAIIAGVGAYRKRNWAWRELRKRILVSVRRNRMSAYLAPRWPAIRRVGGELLFLVYGYVLFALVRALVEAPETDLSRTVVLTYAWYRLSVATCHQYFVHRLAPKRSQAELAKRILRSIRLAGRYILAVVVVLLVSEPVLGRGYLYGLVFDFAWIAVFPIVFLLLRHWRSEVIGSYLSRFPEGRLAKPLERFPSGVVHYLLTVPAVARLIVLGIASELRALALRFERVRRAFAFFSRRRLEKQADSVGHGVVDVGALPADLRNAFDGKSFDTGFEIEHYPDADESAARVIRWRDGGPGFALALFGERGMGKTAWMQHVLNRTELSEPIVTVPSQLWTNSSACKWLSGVVGVAECSTIDTLVDRIEGDGVRRLVALDLCQNLMLRTVGGNEGFDTLVELVGRTQERLVWICSFSLYSWLFLKHVQQRQNLFRFQVALSGWPEEAITKLIRKRMAFCGYETSFKDLLVGRLEGTALESAIINTSEEYLRLLWDYSDGNPRVALHFWLRSLVPTGERQVRVRLFEAPSLDTLEELHEQSRFMLAALVVHENLTVHEASRVLRYSTQDCAALLAFLEANELVEADEGEHLRVTTHWYRAVIRHLERKRLLF